MAFAAVGNKVSHIYSTLHRVVIMAESYHSLGSVAQGAWKLEDLAMGGAIFYDPCVFGYIF